MNQVNQVNKSSPYKSSYRSEIDGLRAFAVLSVVAFHAFPSWLKGGFIGVDVFFVISGFLITSHIFESLEKSKFSLLDFYGRRIRRIFPALILVMVCSLVFGWFVLLADEYNQLSIHVASGAAFLSNFIFASEVGYFDIASEFKPMLHLWSLAVEEQFYIIFPLLLLFAFKVRANLLFVCLIILFASLVVNLSFVSRFPTETFFWPFGRFWELLFGSVLAWFMLYRSSVNTLNLPKFLHLINIIGLLGKALNKTGFFTLLGILLLAVSVFLIDKSMSFPSYTAVLPVLGASLVIIGGGRNFIAKQLLCNRFAIWFGLISYPLYLWHWPILSYLHIIEDGTPHRVKRIIAVLLSVVLAWVTYKFIEKPIRFGNGNKTRRTVALSIGVFLIALLGLYIGSSNLKEGKGIGDVYLRNGLEHPIGSSSLWYEGKDDWLFLGNSYEDTVAKLKLSIEPSDQNISNEIARFSALAKQGRELGTEIALLIGPNKSSVYSEYLPNEVKPSSTRYLSYFTDHLRSIENFYMLDTTETLLRAKEGEGFLYWRTDTHWNQKGAYLAFSAMMELLDLKYPKIQFELSSQHKGDLIGISGSNDFAMHNDDNWSQSDLIDEGVEIVADPNQPDPSVFLGTNWRGTIRNQQGVDDLVVWVVGDSFTNSIKPYLNSSFSNIKYLGHWSSTIDDLPTILSESNEKPDLVLVVRVERSF